MAPTTNNSRAEDIEEAIAYYMDFASDEEKAKVRAGFEKLRNATKSKVSSTYKSYNRPLDYVYSTCGNNAAVEALVVANLSESKVKKLQGNPMVFYMVIIAGCMWPDFGDFLRAHQMVVKKKTPLPGDAKSLSRGTVDLMGGFSGGSAAPVASPAASTSSGSTGGTFGLTKVMAMRDAPSDSDSEEVEQVEVKKKDNKKAEKKAEKKKADTDTESDDEVNTIKSVYEKTFGKKFDDEYRLTVSNIRTGMTKKDGVTGADRARTFALDNLCDMMLNARIQEKKQKDEDFKATKKVKNEMRTELIDDIQKMDVTKIGAEIFKYINVKV